MNVSNYIFQSPYPSQVQVGRPDTSATQEEQSKQTAVSTPNTSLEKAKSVQAVQTQEVKPKVETSSLLDTYA